MEDDFYKVRIIELRDRKEVDEIITRLHENGINVVWVITLKAKQQQLILKEKQDTIFKISETITEMPAVTTIPEITVQLGAFREKSNALGLLGKLTAKYGERVKIVYEDEFYKLRLAGIPIIEQTVLEEMNKLKPEIGELGLKDIWLLPARTEPDEEPAVRELQSPPNRVEWNRKVPDVFRSDSTLKIVKDEIQEPVTAGGPKIALQVAVFYRRSQALRAQKKIASKLNLPVAILQQFDLYRVLVTGFYTREETYQYYPELAGLGYPRILLIEDW
jgi:hypothetical protein